MRQSSTTGLRGRIAVWCQIDALMLRCSLCSLGPIRIMRLLSHIGRVWSPSSRIEGRAKEEFLGGWSPALIGNASAKKFPRRRAGPEAFSIKEASRKPLAFAADAVSYGI